MSSQSAVSNPQTAVLKPPPALLAWPIWCFAAVFYLGAFFLRTAPAVMTTELMRDFHIGGASLGNLSAFYFYAYVIMQIPAGVLTGTMGARRLLTAGAFAAAIGTFLFGSTNSFVVACAGRALLGGATAVALLVALRLAAHWFPGKRFGMMSGLALFFGNMGAVVAQIPLRAAIERFSWREVILGLAGIVLLFSFLSWLIVRDDPADVGYRSYAPPSLKEKTTLAAAFRSVGGVLSNRNILLIFAAQGGLAGTILAYTGLWGAPFLKARYGLSPREAAGIASIMLVAFAFGCPFFGALSDWIGRRKPAYLGGAAITAAGWLAMFYLNGISVGTYTLLAAITGFATGSFIIGFPYGRESTQGRYMGASTGVVNMGNMIGVVVLQPGIGMVLDAKWDGRLVGGAHVYNLAAYHAGFLLLTGWAVLAAVLIAFTRETNCTPMSE